MTQFYIKNEKGEFVDGDEQVDALFREKSDKIVSAKLAKAREKVTNEIREKIEEEVRTTATDKIKAEVRDTLEGEYKQKLADAESKSQGLEISLRRKTIAAEYGFKPELEKYLGDGTDEEMRKEADTLKSNFAPDTEFKTPEKSSEPAKTSFVKLTKD